MYGQVCSGNNWCDHCHFLMKVTTVTTMSFVFKDVYNMTPYDRKMYERSFHNYINKIKDPTAVNNLIDEFYQKSGYMNTRPGGVTVGKRSSDQSGTGKLL